MRVMVYKSKGGKRNVEVLPAPGPGKRPIALSGLSKEDVRGAVEEAVNAGRQQGPVATLG